MLAVVGEKASGSSQLLPVLTTAHDNPAAVLLQPDGKAPRATLKAVAALPSSVVNATVTDWLPPPIAASTSPLGERDATTLFDALEAYASRFPHGALEEEHDAARAIAMCDAHRPEAKGVAARFLAVYTGSPSAARVRFACSE